MPKFLSAVFGAGLFAGAALLAGCATTSLQHPVAGADLARARQLGVFSAFGDTVNGRLVGLTAFGNAGFTAWTPQWGVDRDAAMQAAQLLASGGRFRAVPVDRSAVPGTPLNDGAPTAALWETAARQGIDTLVVLQPDVYDEFPFFPAGVGLYEHAVPMQASGCIYSAFSVHVYDVAARKPLAWEWAGNAPCEFGRKAELPFKKSLDAYAPAEQALLRQRITERVDDGLAYALEKLGMAP